MLSKAKLRANQRWKRKNKNKQKYYVYHSCAKTFITKMASRHQLLQFLHIIKYRLNKSKEDKS